MSETPEAPASKGSLSVTALYTCQAWVYGGFEHAKLFETRYSRRAFNVTNFVLRIVRLLKPGPELPKSLAQRHAMFDRLVEHSGATQVIELAAGLSQRGAVVSKNQGVHYTEVDLPDMVARKRSILEGTDTGRAILARPNLTLMPADALELDLAPLVEPPGDACIVAEGLFMYLNAAQQRGLWRNAVGALRKVPNGTFVFDLTPAVEEWRSGIAGRILDGLLKRATGGTTFEKDERSRHDIAAEIRAAGFDEVRFLEPGPLHREWRLPFPDARTQVLLFECTTRS